MAAGAFTPATRALIVERAWFRCEKCRAARVEHVHHRRPRGMGGDRRPSTAGAANGLALCAPCHHWIESQRTESEELGYLVDQNSEPADVPVWREGQRVHLDDHGDIHPIPEES